MLELKFKRLTDTMTVPTKAHDTDACFDLYADIQIPILREGEVPDEHTTYETSVCFACSTCSTWINHSFDRFLLLPQRGT